MKYIVCKLYSGQYRTRLIGWAGVKKYTGTHQTVGARIVIVGFVLQGMLVLVLVGYVSEGGIVIVGVPIVVFVLGIWVVAVNIKSHRFGLSEGILFGECSGCNLGS